MAIPTGPDIIYSSIKGVLCTPFFCMRIKSLSRVGFDQYVLVLLALFLVIFLHPYTGIRHDSVLYLGQALLRMDPENFRKDLFFAYGSQASFTIFPQVVAFFLRYFSPSDLFLWASKLGLIFFVFSSFVLLRQFFRAPFAGWALVALVVLPSTYGGHRMLSYAEPFFTARSFAESLVLLALAAFLSKRYVLTFLLWALAFLLHPLQSIPLFGVVWFMLVLADRRWLHSLWLVFPVVGGLLFKSDVAARIVEQFDDAWLGWIKEPNILVFPLQRQISDWSFLALDLFFVGLFCYQAKGVRRRLSCALLLYFSVAFLISVIAADWLRLVLLTGVQLWRAQWLLHWFAVAVVPWILWRAYRCDVDAQRVKFWILLGLVLLGMPGPEVFQYSVIVWVLIFLYFFWLRIGDKVDEKFKAVLVWSLWVALLLAAFKYANFVYLKSMATSWDRDLLRPEVMLFSNPLFGGVLIFSLDLIFRRSVNFRRLAIVFLLIAIFYSDHVWDRRNVWTKYIEAASGNDEIFGFKMEVGLSVYWEDELLAPWLILRRPSYYHSFQDAGLVFNRSTAEESADRREVLKVAQLQQDICGMVNSMNFSIAKKNSCALEASVIRQMCDDARGRLGYVVLKEPVNHLPAGVWMIPGGLKGERMVSYYAYRCQGF